MLNNFYQISNISTSNSSACNLNIENNQSQFTLYPAKLEQVASPKEYQISSKESIKIQYLKKKSSSHSKSPDATSQQNTKWTSRLFQDDYLSAQQSDDKEDDQEIGSKDSFFKNSLQKYQKGQSAQLNSLCLSQNNKSLALYDRYDVSSVDKNEDSDSGLEEEEDADCKNDERLQEKLKEIPTCKTISCDTEIQRQIQSLLELPSEKIQKENYLLGEKIPRYYDNFNMEDGFDEIDEINENEYPDKDSVFNHRRKLKINPIFHCNEARLRFEIDSFNTGDENISCQENDDIIVKNHEQLKKNHQQLKQNKLKKLPQFNKSCINL